MIEKLLLNTQIILMIFIRKILKNTFFDDLIAIVQNNEKLNKIVNELFIRGRKLNISHFLSRSHILKYQKMLD